MDAEKEIERLLSVNNAVLERNRRHLVWRIPGKGVFVIASTPGCKRSRMNELSRLRRILSCK